jgi:SAM-dependent methyltransferase
MRKRFFAWFWSRTEGRARRQTADLRARLVGDLEGDILEIGCGTGATFEHYAAAATVTATDYSEHMLPKARSAADAADASIELRQADAGALPFDDASFDAAVSTLVLCSVPDLDQALSELRRVLRPGGALRIFEHVRSDRAWVAGLQRVVNPAWGLVADGCHLNRDTASAVKAAGFGVEREEQPQSSALPFKSIALFARSPAAEAPAV